MKKVDDGIIRQCIHCGKVGLHDVYYSDKERLVMYSCWHCWKIYDAVDVIKAGMK